MSDPTFFPPAPALGIAEIVALTGARLASGAGEAVNVSGAATLSTAGPGDIAFIDSARYAGELSLTRAAAVLCLPRFVAGVPAAVAALESAHPHKCFAIVVARLFPEATRPALFSSGAEISPGAHVDATARLEDTVRVEPGAVIGPGAEIGRGTVIGAGAVIGASVHIGRDCVIGPQTTIAYALVGNGVLIHPGVRIGQDGFGFVPGPDGHLKVPQIGRVIIQDQVEIGANTTIDRGSLRDTVIGEGTKIDNLVQIGHNVVIGRHCLISGHAGISGSSTLGDFVSLGGRAGIGPHLVIGHGASIGAAAGVMRDVPPGGRWVGAPAVPGREFFRAQAALRRLALGGTGKPADRAEAGGQTEGEESPDE